MSRPCKLDALSPAERARRYRLRCKGVTETQGVTETVTEIQGVTETVTETQGVTETVTETQGVTETVTETVAEIQVRVSRMCTLEEWPFPGTELWFRKYGFVRVHPCAY